MTLTHSECLDWMLILNQQHLERVLDVFVTHYNEHRPHRGLSLVPPEPGRLSVASAAAEVRVHRRDRVMFQLSADPTITPPAHRS
jgi:hypothetical protein